VHCENWERTVSAGQCRMGGGGGGTQFKMASREHCEYSESLPPYVY
jgi:hypothetical protein